jgi:hypothetical protein
VSGHLCVFVVVVVVVVVRPAVARPLAVLVFLWGRPWEEGVDVGRRKIAAEPVRARVEEGEDGAVAGVAGDVKVLDERERDPAFRRVRESTESVGGRQ